MKSTQGHYNSAMEVVDKASERLDEYFHESTKLYSLEDSNKYSLLVTAITFLIE